MRQDELRSILLVKAIEEVDQAGTLIPLADRIAATREARRAAGDVAVPGDVIGQGTLSELAQRMGVERTRILLRKIVARHPFVDNVLNLVGGPAWAGWVVVALGLFFGFVLSALDGTRRINILAFPLIGVVLWNLVVCVAIFFNWLRADSTTKQPRRRMPEVLTNFGMSFVARQVAKSGAFNVPLADALRRFTKEWFEVARPLLVARATRLFHLSAVAVGVGLIAGLYVRGIAFDYLAGWESTFFNAPSVRALLSVMYGPASFITDIPIPDVAYVETIRWKEGAGGERAARWIHLLAATVALYVVLPRLVLALVGTISILRWSRRVPLPPSLAAYFRIAFGALVVIDRALVTVIPYAYEPSAAARARLRRLLPGALGESVTLDARAPVRYGDEGEFLQGLGNAGKPDVVVLLFNLAATPEEENHGAVITGVRDWLAAKRLVAQLLVLVDEGPYAARMAAANGGADARVTERRHVWKEFVAARGVGACIVNLALESDETPPPEQTDCVRNALWQPHSA